MNQQDTPIYREAITEAKRRTKRHSSERRLLAQIDADTEPRGTTDLAARTALTEESRFRRRYRDRLVQDAVRIAQAV